MSGLHLRQRGSAISPIIMVVLFWVMFSYVPTLAETETFPSVVDESGKPTIVTCTRKDFDASLPGISAGFALKAVPGLGQVDLLRDAKIQNGKLLQGVFSGGKENGQPWLAAIGDIELAFSQVGEVRGRVIVLSRLFLNEGLRTAVIVTTDPDRLLAKIPRPSLPGDPFSVLRFSAGAAVFSSEEHSWQTAELPGEVAAELRALIPDRAREVRLGKGECLLLRSEIGSNGSFREVFRLIQSVPPSVLFTGTFPEKPADSFSVKASLLSDFSPSFFPSFIQFDMPDIVVTCGKPFLTLASRIHVAFSAAVRGTFPINLSVPLSFDPRAGITATISIPGEWKNPFGLPLSMGSLGLSFNIGSVPSFGLGGVVQFGGKMISMAGAFSAGVIVGMRGTLDRVSFADILTFTRLGPPPSPFSDLHVDGFELSASSIENQDLRLAKGVTVAGELYYRSLNLGRLRLVIHDQKGVTCDAWCKPINLGPIVITGAGPDGREGTSDDGPQIDLKYWPINEPPFNLKQRLAFSGRAVIPGADVTAFIVLEAGKLSVLLDGNFGWLLKMALKAEGECDALSDVSKGASLNVSGSAGSDLRSRVISQVTGMMNGIPVVSKGTALFGNFVLTIDSFDFSGSLQELSGGTIGKLSIKGGVFGQSFSINAEGVSLSNGEGSVLGKIAEIGAGCAVKRLSAYFRDPVTFISDRVKQLGSIPGSAWKLTSNLIEASGDLIALIASISDFFQKKNKAEQPQPRLPWQIDEGIHLGDAVVLSTDSGWWDGSATYPRKEMIPAGNFFFLRRAPEQGNEAALKKYPHWCPREIMNPGLVVVERWKNGACFKSDVRLLEVLETPTNVNNGLKVRFSNSSGGDPWTMNTCSTMNIWKHPAPAQSREDRIARRLASRLPLPPPDPAVSILYGQPVWFHTHLGWWNGETAGENEQMGTRALVFWPIDTISPMSLIAGRESQGIIHNDCIELWSVDLKEYRFPWKHPSSFPSSRNLTTYGTIHISTMNTKMVGPSQVLDTGIIWLFGSKTGFLTWNSNPQANCWDISTAIYRFGFRNHPLVKMGYYPPAP